jgi:hypothetical protein
VVRADEQPVARRPRAATRTEEDEARFDFMVTLLGTERRGVAAL